MSTNGGSAARTDLDGKVVLVTGAGSGIGEACAHRAAAGGARVAVVDITREAAERVASEIGGDARAIEADVAEEASVAEMVATVVEHFGRLDGAINNAGIGGAHFAVGDYTLDDWRRVMRVNLDGVFLCVREEIRAMRKTGGGSIVNMASVLAAAGYPEQVAYVTSKHALVGLTRVAALDHASDGIRVNAVGPAFILTPAGRADDDAGGDRRRGADARTRTLGAAGGGRRDDRLAAQRRGELRDGDVLPAGRRPPGSLRRGAAATR